VRPVKTRGIEMRTQTRIEADEFRTQIDPGQYTCETACTVYLSQGKGDARRDLHYVEHKAGAVIEIPRTVNGHWYGLEPNGDLFDLAPAVLVGC
jgi:hypothetical protein